LAHRWRPSSPAGWVVTTARRKTIDLLRRDQALTRKQDQLHALLESQRAVTESEDPADMPALLDREALFKDDRLRLIFTCCHPALAPETQIALTLHTVAGITTPEIARAFLVSESTLTKRLVRARRKFRDAGISYEVPPNHRLPERLTGVLSVIYLVFNEGYSASSGDALIRSDLCSEAIHLARLLVELMPDEPEAWGLLALMLLNDARREARTDANGDLVTLEDQDRTCWNRSQIDEGSAMVERALRMRRPGPMQLQAAIAALHAEPTDAADADWPQIGLLYAELAKLQPTSVVELNRAVAVAMSDLSAGAGPARGLRIIDELEAGGELDRYHLLHATRADLLRRGDHLPEAADAYRRAIPFCSNPVERRFLERRLDQVERSTGNPRG
jgi:RNA polymerase sigma-70 factor (ECF subfamily)